MFQIDIHGGKNSSILNLDLRLSINEEIKLNVAKNQNISSTRIKERTSFKIGWIQIDLTVVS